MRMKSKRKYENETIKGREKIENRINNSTKKQGQIIR